MKKAAGTILLVVGLLVVGFIIVGLCLAVLILIGKNPMGSCWTKSKGSRLVLGLHHLEPEGWGRA